MNGTISMTRYTSNIKPYTGITIRLEDNSSGCILFEVDMTVEEFGDVVSGRGSVSCRFEIGAVDKAGMVREHKTMLIETGKSPFNLKDTEREELVRQFEEDGWVGRRYDMTNHHNFKGNSVLVNFERFVEP